MSLFDVIRYPVNDIFSDEINSYPREIMIPWLKDCFIFAGEKTDIFDIEKCQSFSTFVRMLILRADLQLMTGSDGQARALKKFFTQNLKDRIRDY